MPRQLTVRLVTSARPPLEITRPPNKSAEQVLVHFCASSKRVPLRNNISENSTCYCPLVARVPETSSLVLSRARTSRRCATPSFLFYLFCSFRISVPQLRTQNFVKTIFIIYRSFNRWSDDERKRRFKKKKKDPQISGSSKRKKRVTFFKALYVSLNCYASEPITLFTFDKS